MVLITSVILCSVHKFRLLSSFVCGPIGEARLSTTHADDESDDRSTKGIFR